MRFEVDQAQARRLNISSQQIADYLNISLTGYTITRFRERDKLIGVDLRAPEQDRVDPSQIERLSIPSRDGTAVPLAALGDHPFARWWSVQAGGRQDFGAGPARTWTAIGVQGIERAVVRERPGEFGLFDPERWMAGRERSPDEKASQRIAQIHTV